MCLSFEDGNVLYLFNNFYCTVDFDWTDDSKIGSLSKDLVILCFFVENLKSVLIFAEVEQSGRFVEMLNKG